MMQIKSVACYTFKRLMLNKNKKNTLYEKNNASLRHKTRSNQDVPASEGVSETS